MHCSGSMHKKDRRGLRLDKQTLRQLTPIDEVVLRDVGGGRTPPRTGICTTSTEVIVNKVS